MWTMNDNDRVAIQFDSSPVENFHMGVNLLDLKFLLLEFVPVLRLQRLMLLHLEVNVHYADGHCA